MKIHFFIYRSFLEVLLISIVLISCNKVRTYPSKAIIISSSIDLTLKDSSLIYGNVYSAEDEKTPVLFANIWIEGTNIKTNSDSVGFFKIKVLHGIYSIKCLGKDSNKDMTVELNNVEVSSSEKLKINFYQGIVIDF